MIGFTRASMAVALATGLLIGPTASGFSPASAVSTGSIDWQPCSAPQFQAWQRIDGEILPGFDCAMFTQPLVRGKSKGKKVHLATVRLAATGTADQYKGVLLFNPGGPGQSGVGLSSIVYLLPEEIRQSFDFITWDPRGIGASKPAIQGAGCNIPKPNRPTTGKVDWQAVLKDRVAQVERMNARCFTGNRPLIEHAGTVANAYDMEAMRKALGQDQITYWGLSYGTLLGSTYIQLFPDRIRAVALDSPMDPQLTLHGVNAGSVAPDHSLGFFLQANSSIKAQYNEVIRRLTKHALRLPDGSLYTRWDVLDVLNDSVMFYVDPSGDWSDAQRVITTAYAALFGQGSAKQRARQELTRPGLRSPRTGTVGSLWSAVVCQDFADRISPSDQRSQMRWAVRNGPVYGGSLGVDYITTCDGYRAARPDPVPIPAKFGPEVRGIVSTSTRDGETPNQWAVNMARVYRKMRMVTLVGGLHGTFGLSQSPCVDSTIAGFLITLRRPAVDLTCSWSPPHPVP